jgi:long-chain acyl-CoA synthetase
VHKAFEKLALAAPDAPAVIEADSGRIVTRGELLSRAREIELPDSGLVALQMPNSAEFVATFLAACMRNLTVVPIDRDAPRAEVEGICGHFGVGVPRTSSSGSSGSSEFLGGMRGAEELRGTLPRNSEELTSRLIKLTSGSTGKPKGIVTSEGNLVADAMNICSSMGIGPDDINLGAIPMSHSYGFSNLVTPLLLQGTAVVVSNDYLPQSLLDLANRWRCTVAPLIPMVFEHLTAAAHGEFETVRTFISAGAPLAASTSRRFRERFGIPIHSFYGCSECGGITYDRRGAAVERGSVGEPLDGVSLDLDGARLRVRSGSVALGYLLDATTFEPFANGAFQTDDLVGLRDGEVVLTGRASDLINTAGKKVNPREIEAVILEIDGVRQVKVYGEPAGARGEVVAAAIVATPDVTREQVREFCRARLSLHKVPRIVKLIEAIPMDERGKVKRAALAQL